jgi:hypothetical protein
MLLIREVSIRTLNSVLDQNGAIHVRRHDKIARVGNATNEMTDPAILGHAMPEGFRSWIPAQASP